MVYRIVQYIQPWEIDDLERQVNQLIGASYSLGGETLILDCTLNLSNSLIDWQLSKLPKQYFLEKFAYIENKAKKHFKVSFDTDETIQGAADKKRSTVYKIQDFVIWLDSDIFFPKAIVPYFISATKHIEKDLYLLTAQIIKYWDTSWDCITAPRFLNEANNHRDYFDPFSLDEIVEKEVSIAKLNQLKFGAGWFTLLTDRVVKTLLIPEEIGSYGPDDTYLIMTGPKIGLEQYLLQGVVVTEIGADYLEKKDYIKPLLAVKTQDKQKITNEQLGQLINKFYESN